MRFASRFASFSLFALAPCGAISVEARSCGAFKLLYR